MSKRNVVSLIAASIGLALIATAAATGVVRFLERRGRRPHRG